MRNPKVSVVIPCYNQAQYVREAVLSVLAQGEPVEIIVIDDYSSNSGEIEHSLKGLLEYITLKRLLTNKGLAGARNAGIRMATGELILPLDADDNLSYGAIKLLKRALVECPQADIAYGFLTEFGEGQGEWGNYGGWPLRALLEANRLPYASMFRRSVWERVGGYDESMRRGFEDWLFWQECAMTGSRFVCVNAVTLLYRRRTGSLYENALKSYNDIIAYMQAKHPEYYVKEGPMRRKIELPISFNYRPKESEYIGY